MIDLVKQLSVHPHFKNMIPVAFENKYCFFEIRNNILFMEYKNDLIITLPIAQQIVTDRLKFQHQENYHFISMIVKLKIKYAHKNAREYLAIEGAKGLISTALVTNSLVTKTLIKIFLTVEKPNIPIRVFEDQESAITWIKKLVIE